MEPLIWKEPKQTTLASVTRIYKLCRDVWIPKALAPRKIPCASIQRRTDARTDRRTDAWKPRYIPQTGSLGRKQLFENSTLIFPKPWWQGAEFAELSAFLHPRLELFEPCTGWLGKCGTMGKPGCLQMLFFCPGPLLIVMIPTIPYLNPKPYCLGIYVFALGFVSSGVLRALTREL